MFFTVGGMSGYRFRAARVALVALACGGAAGCAEQPVTGVHVTVRFSGLMLDQLRFTVTPAGADPIIARRPELADAGVWLRSPQDVMVYLPDYMSGRAVTCEVMGMAQGTATPATGAADTVLELGQMVPASVTLAGSTPEVSDAGAADSQPPPKPKKCPHDDDSCDAH
jgi:hypothetical protein